METAMSDLFDEYPMLIFGLESLLALFLLVFIVVWTSSGKKKAARASRTGQTPQHSAHNPPGRQDPQNRHEQP
jgi:hypothetical protein